MNPYNDVRLTTIGRDYLRGVAGTAFYKGCDIGKIYIQGCLSPTGSRFTFYPKNKELAQSRETTSLENLQWQIFDQFKKLNVQGDTENGN